MNAKMLETLYQVSLLHDPDPGVVFDRICDTVSAYYSGAMVMVNLVDGNCISFRSVANPHRLFRRMSTMQLQDTFCQVSLRTSKPLLIQNAGDHTDFCTHPAVRFKLNRYLGVPVHSPAGDPIGTLCFLDNRTEQPLGDDDIQFLSLLAMRVSAEVERERMVQARVDEQRALAEKLAAANARLEATSEERRRFVATVLHDLRHPLTAMHTLLYLMRDETDARERRSYGDMLENRVSTLTRILDALMQYNEIEAGRIHWEISTVDLSGLITECLRDFAHVLPGDSVRFICEVDPELGLAETDGTKLTHILANLLSNALKFTAEGTITVRARPQCSRTWALEVEDTGIGMNEEEQELIFEEFYRAPAALENRRSGAGLGLAIVKQMSQTLDAEIDVKSAPGVGTRFRIVFPRDHQAPASRNGIASDAGSRIDSGRAGQL